MQMETQVLQQNKIREVKADLKQVNEEKVPLAGISYDFNFVVGKALEKPRK